MYFVSVGQVLRYDIAPANAKGITVTNVKLSLSSNNQQASRFWMLAGSVALAIASLLVVGSSYAANKSQFSAYQHGKPVNYLPCGDSPVRSRTAALMGGGLDVKAAYSWMIAKMAECSNGSSGRLGNFVVIRAGGNPSYDSFIYKLGPLASVVTIVVPTIDSANDPAIEPYIRNAGAIFLTGGDQGDYYNFWKGTLLERLISEQVNTYGVPIGGSSAGMMILSQFNYIAYPYSINSFEALANPFKDGAVTLKNDFWTYKTPFLPLMNTIADSHFDTRDRMGRLVTFLGRVIGDGWTKMGDARAIGVDQETVLLMEYANTKNAGLISMTMTVIANPEVNGAAYILNPTAASNLVVTPGQPLTFTNIAVQKIPVNAPASNYQINVRGGTMSSTSGSIY